MCDYGAFGYFAAQDSRETADGYWSRAVSEARERNERYRRIADSMLADMRERPADWRAGSLTESLARIAALACDSRDEVATVYWRLVAQARAVRRGR